MNLTHIKLFYLEIQMKETLNILKYFFNKSVLNQTKHILQLDWSDFKLASIRKELLYKDKKIHT